MSDISFYETAAQVIPLLLLAGAVDTGFLKNLRPADLRTRAPTKLELAGAFGLFTPILNTVVRTTTGALETHVPATSDTRGGPGCG